MFIFCSHIRHVFSNVAFLFVVSISGPFGTPVLLLMDGDCHPLQGPASTDVVRSLADAYAWLGYRVNCLGGEPLLQTLVAKCYGIGLSMSTAFSGIGAPEHIIGALAHPQR